MRITSIRLTNFLSYHTLDLDLSSVRLASLVGANGSGKSSLATDAITWSLYGEGRCQTADDYISLGQSEATAEVCFELNEQLYRVQRQRRRGKDSQLGFFVRNGAVWKTLNGKGVREPQKAIEDTLRVSYETFTASAMFLQGRADEFLRKTPGERKRILGEILGTEDWQARAELALAKAREAKNTAAGLDVALQDFERRYAALPALQDGYTQAQSVLAAAAGHLTHAQADLQLVKDEKAAAEVVIRERNELSRAQTAAFKRRDEANTAAEAALRRLVQLQETVAQGATIRERHQQLQDITTERDRLQEQQAQRLILMQRVSCLSDVVRRAESQHERILAQARANLATVREKSGKLPEITAQGKALAKEVDALTALQTQYEQARNDRDQLRSGDLTTCNAACASADTVVEGLLQRLARLQKITGTCPTCESPITPEHMKRHLAEVRTELAQAREQGLDASRKSQTVLEKIQALSRKMDELLPYVQSLASNQLELGVLRRQYQESKAAADQLPELQYGVDMGEAEIGTLAADERQQLASVQAELAQLPADNQERLKAIATELVAFLGIQNFLARLEAAERDLPQAEESSGAAQSAAQAIDAELQEIIERLVKLPAPPNLSDIQQRLGLLEKDLHDLGENHLQAQRQLGAAAEAVRACEALAPEVETRRRERDAAKQSAADYATVAGVFGRNGIQALLVESALPTLEDEANALLEKMGGNLSLRLVTQRELASGKGATAETLEVIASDAAGERRFEHYSGGEQARLALALRIAVSRLLTSRAGARIQTLIIDEAFAPVDAAGRQAVVDCLQTIGKEFELVLIVTHDEALKDAFPSQIMVTKTDAGSQVEVL